MSNPLKELARGMPDGMHSCRTDRRGTTQGLRSLVDWFASRQWTVARLVDGTWQDVREPSKQRRT